MYLQRGWENLSSKLQTLIVNSEFMHQSGILNLFFIFCSPMKRKNPEDGKEESSMSGGESSLYTDKKNLGTSKVCDPTWRVPYSENSFVHE